MKRYFIVAGSLMMLASCYNDKYDKLYPPIVNPCDTTTISYTADIRPIMVAGCFSPGSGCHDAAGAAASGYDFETNTDALRALATGGQLLGSVKWETGYSQMPKAAPKLSDCEINKIARWVHLGAPNN